MKPDHQAHCDFLRNLRQEIYGLSREDQKRLKSDSFRKAEHKVETMNFDPLSDLFHDLYSFTGRPPYNPVDLLRCLVIMMHFEYTSIQKWHDALAADHVLQILCGVKERVPSVGTFYNFINRLWSDPSPPKILNAGINSSPKKEKRKGKRGRPKKNCASHPEEPAGGPAGTPNPSRKGDKLNLNKPGATEELAQQASQGIIDPDRPNRLLQEIIYLIGVKISIKLGLINPKEVIICGDGTALHIHTNSRGHHIKALKGTPEYERLRRYMDPEAGFGYDSDLEVYYYGYTLYFICHHNSESGVDLPLLFSLYPAKEHDSTLAIKALNNTLEVHDDLKITHFCLDSASDNRATYTYCLENNIIPVIDRNPRRGGDKKIGTITVNSKGIPVCPKGEEMVLEGHDRCHNAIKYRCPLVKGKISSCEHRDACSKTPYGRTFYHKQSDVRDQSGLIFGSPQWKKIYANRTACERINNRVLNDYGLHATRTHTSSRLSTLTAMALLNIHADAWWKVQTSENN